MVYGTTATVHAVGTKLARLHGTVRYPSRNPRLLDCTRFIIAPHSAVARGHGPEVVEDIATRRLLRRHGATPLAAV
jgi:hypothetical protein